jgi:2-oxoglutarate ferredoxin oxidoreductase subunit alpha
VEEMQNQGKSVSSVHLRHLNPFPRNLGDILGRFDRVLVPELNMGQLCMLLRSRFLVPAISFPKVKGKPFKISELTAKMDEVLED